MVVANERLVFSSDVSVERRDNEFKTLFLGWTHRNPNALKGKKLTEFNGTRKPNRIQWNTKYFSKPAEK